jgi:hypothetical protein
MFYSIETLSTCCRILSCGYAVLEFANQIPTMPHSLVFGSVCSNIRYMALPENFTNVHHAAHATISAASALPLRRKSIDPLTPNRPQFAYAIQWHVHFKSICNAYDYAGQFWGAGNGAIPLRCSLIRFWSAESGAIPLRRSLIRVWIAGSGAIPLRRSVSCRDGIVCSNWVYV